MYSKDFTSHLAKAISNLKSTDPDLFNELTKGLETERHDDVDGMMLKFTETVSGKTERRLTGSAVLETIVMKDGRPVLAIQDNDFIPAFTDPPSAIWKNRLGAAHSFITDAIPSVGRIELNNHPSYEWVGTGWLLDENIVVTNRHVASIFAIRGNNKFIFRAGVDFGVKVTAKIDFLEEYDRLGSSECPVTEVLWIEPEPGPDLAFLRIISLGGGKSPAKPISLHTSLASVGDDIAAIGYPARDSRIPDQQDVIRIFGDIYDKKRLAPGRVMAITKELLQHDCSTLGGNSGSVLLSLKDGKAVGLHFAGQYLQANYAVPSPLIHERLAKVLSGEATALYLGSGDDPSYPNAAGGNALQAVNVTPTGGDQPKVTFTVPLEITIQIGNATISGQAKVSQPGRITNPTDDELKRALDTARRIARGRSDIFDVRLGYRFRNGWITDERAIVFSVRHKTSRKSLEQSGDTPLPAQIEGIGTDITTASPWSILQKESGLELPFDLEGVKRGNYQPPAGLELRRVKERMRVVIHLSPDAGYPQLSQFINRTEKTLTVGIYEFTAEYIYKELIGVLEKNKGSLKLVVQRFDKNGKQPDEMSNEEIVAELKRKLGKHFDFAWASVSGPDKQFANAYHIKVAVRDSKEMWLSSGNWKPSNQPNCDPIREDLKPLSLLKKNNRDWHAIIACPSLAEQFERYLQYDLDQARAFEAPSVTLPEVYGPDYYHEEIADETRTVARFFSPLEIERELDIQPLLTPDNYSEHVLALIESAKERIYFQNQSLNPLATNDPGFERLLNALKEKQDEGLDVKIIFRDPSEFGGADNLRKAIEALKDYGFDTSRFKVQRKCHTKGIMVDGEAAMLGSHNWTNAGTLYNRDASLIFFDKEITEYLEKIFLHDWVVLAQQKINEEFGPFSIGPANEGAYGMRAVDLSELID